MLREDVQAAVDHGSESESVDYKAAFDSNSSADWAEIIKDIVALANSGGGVIVFGVADDGTVSEFDCSPLAGLDPADLTNKLYKYTGQQIHAFEFVKATKGAKELVTLLVKGAANPIVFSKPGTYDIGGGKQKTAFSAGTVYFRHGAKSEPGNSDDLRWFLERRIEEIRKSWLEGIVKVVEAPAGAQVQIISSAPVENPPMMRLVNDPSAPAYYRASVDQTHPFRQKEVVEEVNKALQGTKIIKPFHVQCVRQAHKTDDNATFCYKQKYASARYSHAFVKWIIEQYTADQGFFENAKAVMEETRRAVVSGSEHPPAAPPQAIDH
jgi:hypothetical protein